MALVLEDGSGVANANSYVAVADVRTFATDRGIDLSALSDAAVTAFILNATDYLESLWKFYVGCPATVAQALSWPRQNVFNPDSSSFPSSGAASIPLTLKNAQCQLCLEQQNGVTDLLPTTDNNSSGGFITSRKTDVLETHFSERIGTDIQPVMPKVDRWLQTLLAPRPGGLRVERV